MIERWQSLLNQIEIIETPYGSEIWTQEELEFFENETGIIFPVGYKEFCQVFGTGCFGNLISIYCPNLNLSNTFLRGIKDDITGSPEPEHEKRMSRESLINLLDSGFIFGSEPSSISIFWDMNSYHESDQGCDIYWANTEDFSGDIYQIGRDFYEFITEFCLGTKSYEILPQKEWFPPEAIQRTFTRVNPIGYLK